jgi:hypothetical protein
MAPTYLSDPGIKGPHGNFAWSCGGEGCLEDPRLIVGIISDEGPHIYAGCCLEDVLRNPQTYADSNLILHGTHQLNVELLEEFYGPGRGMPEDDRWRDNPIDGFHDGPDDRSDYLAVAIDAADHAYLLTAESLLTVLDHPERFPGFVLYGTHILDEDTLTEFFGPADEGDRP